MRTISVRDWLGELGISGEIIPGGKQTWDKLSPSGQAYIRQAHIISQVMHANCYRIRKGEYIYLTDTACYHSITLHD